jgi:hypothetical protein
MLMMRPSSLAMAEGNEQAYKNIGTVRARVAKFFNFGHLLQNLQVCNPVPHLSI